MYYEYFGIREAPFSIAPNPQYLYMSERHREALAHLLYGIKSDGGFILLTGEVGTGKTTVCRCLLEQIPEDVNIAFVLNPKLTAVELLATACDDLGIEYPQDASIKILVDKLNEFLLASHKAGKRTVLIIDEAQNLSVDVLEQLRLLTNLETNQRKLLQIILLGQPELLDLLNQKELRQLSQRVTARFHLEALDRKDVHEYIKYRLSVAGAKGMFFPSAAVNRIYKISEGIPRVINLICDRALLGAYSENKFQVSTKMVNKAAEEIKGKQPRTQNKRPYAIAAMGVVLALNVGFSQLSPNPELSNVSHSATTANAPQSPIFAAPVLSPNKISRTNRTDLVSITNIQGHEDARLAFADLFVLWGLAFEDKQSPSCTLAVNVGLACFSDLGGLTDLIRLDRPVVIGINNQWLTLSSLTDGVATLISGGRQFDVDARELSQFWDGKYTLFWRMPPAYERPLTIGDKGAAVDWLATQLALIDSSPLASSTGNEFDSDMQDRLKRFQLGSGITPNGIANIQTWIHINSFQPAGIPMLSKGNG